MNKYTIALVVALLAIFSSQSEAQQSYRVTGVMAGDFLNMREGPSVTYQIIQKLENNVDGIVLIGEPVFNGTTEWQKIKSRGVVGWVNADYLAPYNTHQITDRPQQVPVPTPAPSPPIPLPAPAPGQTTPPGGPVMTPTAATPPAESAPTRDMPNEQTLAMLLVFGLAFGVVLSWSIELAPALIYRYVIYKGPIVLVKAVVLLAPVIGVLAFAYTAAMARITETPSSGNPLPWVLMFLAGVWIMARGRRSSSAAGLKMDMPPAIAAITASEFSQRPPIPSASVQAPPGPKGIGGWLLFFCVCLTILDPLRGLGVLAYLWTTVEPLFAMFPTLKFALIWESTGWFALMIYGSIVGCIIWNGNPQGRSIARRFLLIQLYGFIGIELIALLMILDLPKRMVASGLSAGIETVCQRVVSFLIWWLYFKKSQRVKNTYGESATSPAKANTSARFPKPT